MKRAASDPVAATGATVSPGIRGWSRTGLALCAFYFVTTCACGIMAFDSNYDGKSRFIFLQMPIVLQSAAAYSLGLYPSMQKLPVFIPYGLMLLIGFGVLYAIGCVVGKAGHQWHRRTRRSDQR